MPKVAILVGSRDGDPEDPLDDRRRRAVQDGRSRPDHRRHPRRAARVRQRDLAGGRAKTKGIVSPVAGAGRHPGRAGSRSRQHAGQAAQYLADADGAGIVVGARVPIVLTSRADSVRTRLYSTAALSFLRTIGARSSWPASRTRDSHAGRRHPRSQRGLLEPQVLAVHAGADEPALAQRGQLEGLVDLHPLRGQGRRRATTLSERTWPTAPLGHDGAMEFLLGYLRASTDAHTLRAVGHRVVHGGTTFAQPVRVDDGGAGGTREARAARTAASAAQPGADPRAARARARRYRRSRASTPPSTARCRNWRRRSRCRKRSPTAACAGTAFMGLSYEYIASVLPQLDPAAAAGRTVVAHLGNGASHVRVAGRAQHRVDDGVHGGGWPHDGHAHGGARSRRHALPDGRTEARRPRDREADLPGVGPARACPASRATCARCSRAPSRARSSRSSSSAIASRANSVRWRRRSAVSMRSCSRVASANTRHPCGRRSWRRPRGSDSRWTPRPMRVARREYPVRVRRVRGSCPLTRNG